jgi:hypothetical protein
MATARSKLREELTARFVPLLRQRGFAGPDRIAGNALFHDFRRTTAAGTQVLSIQFEKYQRPRCILNLWVEPLEGVDAVISRGGTVIQGRVQPRWGASTRKWFRADHPWWQRMLGRKSTREREAVSEAIALLDEIDRWWQAKQPSPHISTIELRYGPPTVLRRRYSRLLGALTGAAMVLWLFLVAAFFYGSRVMLGLPLEAGSLEGLGLKFVTWIVVILAATPILLICSLRLVRGIFSLLMIAAGKFTFAQARAFARSATPPERWLQPAMDDGGGGSHSSPR